MAELFVAFDAAAEDGEKFGPEVAAEIAFVAPSTLNDGSVTTAKLNDIAVTTAKIADGAVLHAKIGTSQVKALNLDTNAVTTTKINNGAVTPDKVGNGVVTSRDNAGEILDLEIVRLTSAQYETIVTPSPNTMYVIVGS